MNCLPPMAVAAAMAQERDGAPCVAVELDLAGRYTRFVPDAGLSHALTLPRAKVGVGVGSGPVSGRVLLSGVRSGGEDNYIGIEGEAIVPELQVAEARADLVPFGVAIGAGLVDDPWVISGERAWGLPGVAPSLGESVGWLDRSDLGLWVGWTGPKRIVSVRVDVTSGEGNRGRERNEGKNVGGHVAVRPLAFGLGHKFVTIEGWLREGSRGLASVRDIRAGARASTQTDWVDGGVEWLGAWGVDGDAARQPAGVSAFAALHPWKGGKGKIVPAVAFARFDHTTELAGDPDTAAGVLRLGGGIDLDATGGAARVLLGWEHVSAGAAVAEVAGATAFAGGDAIFVQFDLATVVETP